MSPGEDRAPQAEKIAVRRKFKTLAHFKHFGPKYLLRCLPASVRARSCRRDGEPRVGIGQLVGEQRIEGGPGVGIAHRRHHLDPHPQVARPPVRRPDVVLVLPAVRRSGRSCACSRNRPSRLTTRMRSECPGTPGRRVQSPRTISSMVTPARDARYSAWITSVSASPLSLARIRAGRPALGVRRSPARSAPAATAAGPLERRRSGGRIRWARGWNR